MKLNEEVDAMRVLGLNPNQMLIIPRILGLVIALPILTTFCRRSRYCRWCIDRRGDNGYQWFAIC